MRLKPTVTSTEIIARTGRFQVERIGLRFTNGREVSWERLKSSARGAVLVVPMLDADTVLLIREYAAGVERYELALPKGGIEDHESVLEAGNRELMEETGYGARKLTPLKSVTLAPGAISHATHLVLAEELYPAQREGDEPEPIEVVPWKLAQLDELLAHEECTEARSIVALYMVRDLLQARA